MSKLQTLKLGDDEYVVLPKAEYLRLRRTAEASDGSVDAVEYARGSIGRTLLAARKQSGLTQTALAERMGKSQPMISGAEKGSVSVSERYVASVLKACGLPSDWSGPKKRKKRSAS